jgi:hypothetical protein
MKLLEILQSALGRAIWFSTGCTQGMLTALFGVKYIQDMFIPSVPRRLRRRRRG